MKLLKLSFAFIMTTTLVFSLMQPAAGSTSPSFSDGMSCQLKNPVSWAPFGFPRDQVRLKSSGVIKAKMIFVDFPDAKATDRKRLGKVAKRYITKFEQFYREQSYGQLDFQVDFEPRYYRLPSSSRSYLMNLRKGDDGSGGSRYVRDAIDAADPTVDFTGYEAIYVIPSNTNREITYGPSIPLRAGDELMKTDEGIILNGAIGGTDSRLRENSLEWSWLAHETGHLFGIAHPWKLNSDPQGRSEYSAAIAVWDLMVNLKTGSTGEFLGWSRFQIGWIAPDRLTCIEADSIQEGSTKFEIRPLWEAGSKSNFAVIKLSPTKAIAVEVRENNGLNKFPKSWEGPLVYEVDAGVTDSNGGLRVLGPTNRRHEGAIIGTLRPGERVNYGSFVLTYLKKGTQGYEFEVRRR